MSPARWFFVLSLATIVGCVHPLSRRFEADTGCSNVTSRERLGAGLYEVRGCGRRVRYVCAERMCVREREERPTTVVQTAAPTPPPAAEGPPEGVHTGRAEDGRQGVRLVLRDGSTTVIFIGVPADHRGTVRMEARDRSNRPIDQCDHYGLLTARSEVQVPTGSPRVSVEVLQQIRERLVAFDVCGRRLRVNNTKLAHITAFLARFDDIAANVSTGAGVSEGGEVGEGGDEARIRARIAERSAAVLVCLGGEGGAISARWDGSGAVELTVRGQEASSPVHGCVRAAVGELRATGDEPGELLHPVAP